MRKVLSGTQQVVVVLEGLAELHPIAKVRFLIKAYIWDLKFSDIFQATVSVFKASAPLLIPNLSR